MNPNEIGKKLGIGIRVAGRIAQQRAQEESESPEQRHPSARFAIQFANRIRTGAASRSQRAKFPRDPQVTQFEPCRRTRHWRLSAPFGRVGGILWLEMTGFFFGLFALYFAVDLWRTRLSYAAGPQHSRFLIAATLTVIFSYLSASSFWRANRK